MTSAAALSDKSEIKVFIGCFEFMTATTMMAGSNKVPIQRRASAASSATKCGAVF